MNGEDRPKAASTQRPTDGISGDGGHRKLRLLDVARMAATEPPPVPWVVEGLVIQGCLTLLAGRAGEGKSLLAQALALAAAREHGGEVGGLAVERGRVLIVDAENGPDEIHRRVRALGVQQEDASRLTVAEADGFHLARDLDRLEALVAAVKPGLLVLDGFRSLWAEGDENDSSETSQVLGQLRDLTRRHRIGTILIHHSPRRGPTYRGSSAIAASVELLFVLERVEGDDDPQRRRLRCEKCRPASEPSPRWVRLASSDQLADGRLAIQAAEPFVQSAARHAKTTDLLIPEIVELLRRNGPLIRADIARRIGRSPTDGSVGRALQAATAATDVVLHDGRYRAASHDGTVAGSGDSGRASQPATEAPAMAGSSG